MHKSLLIVDDLYRDPEAIRRKALTVEFPEVQGERTFPGRTSLDGFLPEGFDEAASRMLGEPLMRPARPTAYHGCFRITLAGEEGRYHVHADPSDLHWVGVIYLNPPEQCQGGTSFFRHKALGLDRTPETQSELERVGASDVAGLLARDGKDPDKWEHIMTVPMRFNRMILYRPWMWHSAGAPFGDSDETGRLIQLLSFERRRN